MRKFVYCLLAASVFISATAVSQERMKVGGEWVYVVQGSVKDQYDNPINDVRIEVWRLDRMGKLIIDSVGTATDVKGTYRIFTGNINTILVCKYQDHIIRVPIKGKKFLNFVIEIDENNATEPPVLRYIDPVIGAKEPPFDTRQTRNSPEPPSVKRQPIVDQPAAVMSKTGGGQIHYLPAQQF